MQVCAQLSWPHRASAQDVINMPVDRWTLFVAPALLGAGGALLGTLLVFALIAFALGRSMRRRCIAAIGSVEPRADASADLVSRAGAGWLLALGWRKAARPS
jgi:hypothetical protein